MTDMQGQAAAGQGQFTAQNPSQVGANPFNLVGNTVPQAAPVPGQPMTAPVQQPIPQAQGAPTPAPEGFVDKMINGIIKFVAKLTGQADPMTGQ